MKSVHLIWSMLFCLSLGISVAGAQDAAEPAVQKPTPPETVPEPPATDAVDSGPAPADEPAQPQEPVEQPAELATGSVARSTFTTGVQNREPVDQVTTATTAIDTIYFFSELEGLEGQTVMHRWEYDGDVMAEVSFDVGGSRWRVWSTKKMLPTWTGQWTVSVVNGSGEVIDSKQFQYQPAPEPEAADSGPASPTDMTVDSGADQEAGAADETASDSEAEQPGEPAAAE